MMNKSKKPEQMEAIYIPIFKCPTCGLKPSCIDASECPWRIYLGDDELKKLTELKRILSKETWVRCQNCGLGYDTDSEILKISENKKYICPKCGSTRLLPLEIGEAIRKPEKRETRR